MIKPVEYYKVICDNCGHDTSGYSELFIAWDDPIEAVNQAQDADWREIDDKHYCPECWEWDLEKDEAVIKVKEATI